MKLFTIMFVAALAACVMPGTQTGFYEDASATPSAQGTRIYINGQELTAAEQARLEELVGEPVPAARYVLDEQGNFGYEGQPQRVNLAAYIRARQQRGGPQGGESPGRSMYTTDAAGRGSSMTSYGTCVAMSTPTATFLGSGC